MAEEIMRIWPYVIALLALAGAARGIYYNGRVARELSADPTADPGEIQRARFSVRIAKAAIIIVITIWLLLLFR